MTAAAAAVVVLPTPPGPQAMTISLVASRPSIEPLPPVPLDRVDRPALAVAARRFGPRAAGRHQ